MNQSKSSDNIIKQSHPKQTSVSTYVPPEPKKLKTIFELPSWFNLEDYTIARDFGLAEWCDQITTRVGWAQHYYDVIVPRFMGYQEFKRSQLWKKHLECINRHGVPNYAEQWDSINQERKQRLKQPFAATGRADDTLRLGNMTIVSPVTKYDMYTAYQDLPDTDAKKAYHHSADGAPSRAMVDKQLARYQWDNLGDPLNQPYDDAIIELDLMADDKSILADVKDYLAQVRKKQGDTEYYVRHDFRALDFRRWHRNHLLACADLMIWGLYHHTILSDSILSEALEMSYDRYCRCVRPEIKQLYKLAGFLTARYSMKLSRQTPQQKPTNPS